MKAFLYLGRHGRLLFTLAGLLLATAAWAQQPTPRPAASPDSLRSLENRPPPLEPVVSPNDTLVRVSPCPGAGTRVRVGSILFAGNHRTVARVLQAELSFREGDSLTLAELPKLLEANRQRIYNLQLFHAVLAQASCGGSGQLTVLFSVQERWYVLPVPILSLADPDFNRWRTRPDRWQRIDYGLHLVDSNFRGHAEQLTANVQFGFNRKFELLYEAPGLGRRRRVGLGFGASYYQSRSLDYATQLDRPVSIRQVTAFPIQRFYVSGGLRLRHTVQLVTAFDVSYHREVISDSILLLNPTYFLNQQERQFIDVNAFLTLNQRNTFAYPLTGQFAQVLGGFRQFVGAGRLQSYATVRLHYVRYLPLGGNFYHSMGLWAATRLFNGQAAYADARTLGGDVQVRGYNAYVVEGRTYAAVQQGLSFRAWAPRPINLPLIHNPKINPIPLAVYLNAFFDIGYSDGRLGYARLEANRLAGQELASMGLGLHLVTYYDKVYRFEVGRTLHLLNNGLFYLVNTSFPI